MIENVGVRELQQHASRVLRRVKAGETIGVTERGHLVAVLSPLSAEEIAWQELLATGKVSEGKGGLDDLDPLPLPPDTRPLSEVLIEMRDEDER